ncbi:MAG: hypothetical protein UR25_C0001G0039 [Candidatus Nomurabacteria bacterium GW2011_GWE1_32_28]|uniref:Transglutaminase-like domain-containing protein n=1 Tax=Candidatus Nomurabacteria bacterium GW2011_GWF1_31_48 TaxID=1618767 RepID=A0A0F9YU07_9BACT|nr:MAG: hypothetical protein UR10_C0005G0009 [Candidatus Nomurabacteria bacterium GW2011_GWF2_30_133]KKP28361.1 MAG: hypothetical protein UR18_C0005G0009 [Candidatus Nomurabacteria bacterium GW2011_GWE2_31_40]KKP29946.1 MAG: hypothetical protein UR19_C0006G0009 [Candidatus Nomurabacteria bacterium GW2011_GWF1_31_48]KKP35127.1 MAG: hypothetical protein UR25_C0001G0039 [Candidatus Nomurabacteria bacterium GW2011_GWE1_32_28]HAS80939.1 hypothetical protein [Candidatus Nomurabacteria bacterium]
MLNFTHKEIVLMNKLNTPAKVQDFLNSLKFNLEKDGKDTLKSPIKVLRMGNAHCTEGAILGAYILSLHGFKPYILHLKTVKGDFDHVIAPFRQYGFWGALSKTNHSVLRYREPIYKNIHELVMSYFHEYFLDNGLKTLRSYSIPLNLNIFEKGWEIEEDNLWGIDQELDKIKHYDIAPKIVFRNLKKADKIEIKAGKIVEF